MLYKLVAGLAATFLLTYAAWRYERQALLADLGTAAATTMLAHGVTDGTARWTDGKGTTWRIARLSGTASPATRSAIIADLKRHPGIHDAIWS